MTIGGKLTVTNNSAYKKFTVNFSRNTEITNFTQREMGEQGDIRTNIKSGYSGTTEKIYSNGKKSDKLATLDLNSKRYAIFDALRKLDGNENDLSDKDLANANKLIGKNGVTGIRRDAAAGVTTIVCDDGAVLRFDVETDAEKEIREKKEAEEALKRQEEAKQRELQEQQKAAEFNEKCKSDLEKLWDWFVGLF